jgi:hypothetical protein
MHGLNAPLLRRCLHGSLRITVSFLAYCIISGESCSSVGMDAAAKNGHVQVYTQYFSCTESLHCTQCNVDTL